MLDSESPNRRNRLQQTTNRVPDQRPETTSPNEAPPNPYLAHSAHMSDVVGVSSVVGGS